MREGRIHFIVGLRAVAVLIVMFSHLWQTFHFSPDIMEEVFYVIPLPALNFGDFWVAVFTTPPNVGQIGVGVFFLISGFIIPLSLEKQGSVRFLLHRFFRLYPAFLACVLLWCAAAFLYWGLTRTTGGSYSVLQLVLAPLGYRKGEHSLMSGVLWTLILEWQFYFISAVLFGAAYVRQWKLERIGAFHLIMLITAYFVLSLDARFSLLLMGLACFLYYKKRLNPPVFLLLNIGLFGFSCLRLEPWRSAEYLIGVIIWYLYYFFGFSAEPGRFMAFLARLSYPLYLTHTICYFGVSYFVNFVGTSLVFAYIFWIFFIFFLSFLVTKYIEEPCIMLGKKLIK